MKNIRSTTLMTWGRWTATALSLLTALVLYLGMVQQVHAATPAAGTVIGNQATATYTDANNTSRSTTSNLVQTTVAQVKSFTLTADGAKTAAPGQTVYYPHTITNTGNGTDTYALAAAVAASGSAFDHTSLTFYIDANGDGMPDNFTPLTSSGALASGSQFKFVLAGVVPANAALNAVGKVTVTVTDTNSGTPNSATNTDATTVSASSINVTKDLSLTSGPSPSTAAITVTLRYTNSGTAAATSVTLTDALPAGMSYVTNSGRWSASATALTDAANGDPSGINYQYNSTNKTVTAVIDSVAAGASGTVTFSVNINSGLSPTTPSNAPATTNTATYSTSTQATATNTNSVTYTVLQAGSVVANGSSSSSTNGTGEPVTIASAAPGATITFDNYIWNTGNGNDSFNVVPSANSFPTGTTITLLQGDGVTSLLDSNGDSIPDTGPLAPGAVYKVVVKATIPSTAAVGGPYSVTLTATSNYSSTVSDTVIDTLTSIGSNSVDLTNNKSVAGGAATIDGLGAGTATVIATNTVNPSNATSTQTTFKLYVNNTSAVADSYNLSVTTAIPAGWNVKFTADGGAGNCSSTGATLTSTSTIAAGGSQLVCAVVTVPATSTGNATATNYDFTFKAVSALNTSVSDTIADRVTVNPLHSVSLTPNGAQQTFPGGSVTYTHTLTNTGNVTETITFPGFLTDSQAAAGWTSAAYIDTGDGALDVATDTLATTSVTISVASAQSKTVFVRIFAPGSATATSPANVSTLTATYNSGGSSVFATDTTSVTDGLLLLKEQVATPCDTTGNLAPSSGYSNAAIAASSATAPGKCIAYKITATNTTAAAITNVLLSDNVPANTTRIDTCGTPTTSAGTVGGTAAIGTLGTVTASVPALASNASFAMTFCVKINP